MLLAALFGAIPLALQYSGKNRLHDYLESMGWAEIVRNSLKRLSIKRPRSCERGSEPAQFTKE